MIYKRTGECNQCGECCGYPRSSDGGQNNPWASDIIESVNGLSTEAVESELPILTLIGVLVKRGKTYGCVSIANRRCFWIYVPGHGICTDLTPHGDLGFYDQRCPFLDKKRANGAVQCILYNTGEKHVWDKLCQPVPPDIFDNPKNLGEWKRNCPSCSYVFVEEEG